MSEARHRTTQSSPFVQTPAQGDCIALNVGQPSIGLLPLEAMHRAAVTALGPDQDRSLLQYGAAAGYPAFREHLASFLSAQLGRPVDPLTLLVTGGNSQALAMVSQVLAKPGAQVVSEDPTYFLSRRIFEQQYLEVRGVPVDRDGLRVDVLEEQIRSGELRPALVYCIPSFHNPTGACLSAERAARLLDLAAEHGFVVVSDNPYRLLSFAAGRPSEVGGGVYGGGSGAERVVAGQPDVFAAEYGTNPHLIELGSFSKILGPGLRLGWIEAAPELRRRVLDHGILRSGGGINPLVSALVEPTLCGETDGGAPFLATHLHTLRTTFAERARSLAGALRRHLPEAGFFDPSGGYYLWLDLGAEVDSVAFLDTARDHGAGFLPGPRCSIEHDLARHARLSVSFYRVDELELAAERLGTAFRRHHHSQDR